MGIFSSNESNDRTMAKNKRTMSDQINLVGEGTTFEGTLRTQNDVRASGRIVGTMHVDGRAIIAKSGGVEGEIIATNADIAGHVEGEIRVAERLVLKSTARIDGDIHTKQLVVEEGARFTGQCTMGDEAATTDRASTSSDSDASASAKEKNSKKGTSTSDTTASSRADTASSS
jgi:cytoskeletal protein CcmA (bactofilin family)